MSLPAHLEPLRNQPGNRRTAVRRKLTLGSTVADFGTAAMIHNLSSTGLLIETPADLGSSESFEVHMRDGGASQATVVWSSGHFFGCRFKRPVPLAAISAALLRSGFDPHPRGRSVLEAQTAFALFESPSAEQDQAPDSSSIALGPTIGALLLAALIYFLLTAGLATIAVVALALGVVLALMIATLVWTQDHVLL